ncbi:MAG: class I SAM-dependent methyltransferase [Candidatus Eiseniibacteriota bacterium]|nr:MAG: class I SAM-dependent methyltransferase [Candidatus Eisenbacteria bacterium]
MKRERSGQLMRDFWDAKALENAMYYVSSYRGYDQRSPEEFWQWGRTLAERFLRESGIRFTGEESVLEIGCGIGRMTAYFAERFRQVSAVDVSPRMIEQARSNLDRYSNVSLLVCNGYDLNDFEDARFDFVFSYITFQHIPDAAITARYIGEAGRVLRDGGHFYFQVNNLPQGVRERLRVRSRLRALLGRVGDSEEAPSFGLSRGPTDLENPAWRGSRVSVERLKRACRRGYLEILGMEGEGTQYLWVKAARKARGDRGVS